MIPDSAVDQARSSLSTSLQKLRTLLETSPSSSSRDREVNVVQWNDAASQTFARLALTTYIEWGTVEMALQEHYPFLTTSSLHHNGTTSHANAKIRYAGEYGLELVLRVLKRFQKFEFDDDKKSCIEWCEKLKEIVESEGSSKDQSTPQGTKFADTPITAAPPSAFVNNSNGSSAELWGGHLTNKQKSAPIKPITQPFTSPLKGVKRTAAQASLEAGSENDSSKQRQADSSKQIRVDTPPLDIPNLNNDPNGNITMLPGPNSKPNSSNKDDFKIGDFVLAKGLYGKEPSKWFVGMIFDIEIAPVSAGSIMGSRSPTSKLIALIGLDEWHWVLPSRLKPGTPDRLERFKRSCERDMSKESSQSSRSMIELQIGASDLVQDRKGVQKWAKARRFGGVDWALKKDDVKSWLTRNDSKANEKENENSSQVDPQSGSQKNSTVCSCQEVWRADIPDQPDLVGCDNGEACAGYEWYHASCVRLDPSNLPDKWYCPACAGKAKK